MYKHSIPKAVSLGGELSFLGLANGESQFSTGEDRFYLLEIVQQFVNYSFALVSAIYSF